MLGRHDDGIDPHRPISLVFHRNLGLAVGAQVGEGSLRPHLVEATGQPVCQRDRQGHQLRCLVAGKSEHHPLISGTDRLDLLFGHPPFPFFQRCVHPHRDVGGLFVDGRQHRAGIRIKAVFGTGITDFPDGFPDDFRNIDITGGGNLAGNQHQSRRHRCFTGDPGIGILGQNGVQNRVGNLITDFVRMSCSHGLGRKQAA